MVTKSDLTQLRASVEARKIPNTNLQTTWWKPQGEEGEFLVRILPPISSSGLWFYQTAQYKIGNRYFYAPHMVGRPDPIFDRYRRMVKEDYWSLGEEHQIRPRRQYLCNIVVREVNGKRCSQPESVFIFSMGQSLFKLVMGYFWKDGFGDITDVDHGFDLRIVKRSRGRVSDYRSSFVEPQSSKLARDQQTVCEILVARHDLANSVVYCKPEVLKAAMDEHLQTIMPMSV